MLIYSSTLLHFNLTLNKLAKPQFEHNYIKMLSTHDFISNNNLIM